MILCRNLLRTDQAQTVFSGFIVNVTWYKITQPTKTNWLVPAYPLCINIEPINSSNGSLLFRCKFEFYGKPGSLQNVSPVFKKGEKYGAANYRPVLPTRICCKTLEHMLVSNINRHFALDSILADCQHGFQVRGPAKPSWSSLCTTSSATWMGLWIVDTNRQIWS